MSQSNPYTKDHLYRETLYLTVHTKLTPANPKCPSWPKLSPNEMVFSSEHREMLAGIDLDLQTKPQRRAHLPNRIRSIAGQSERAALDSDQ